MTKREKEVLYAVELLRDWGLVEGTTVYGKVTHVSRSGMRRNIELYIIKDNQPVNISYWAAKALEWGYKDGCEGGIKVGGCGMDMIFHTIDCLSYALGYGALNQGAKGESKGLIYKSL